MKTFLCFALLGVAMSCGTAVASDPFTRLGETNGHPMVSIMPAGGDANVKMVFYNLDGRIVVFFERTAIFSRPSWETHKVHRGTMITYITAVADGETLGGGFNGFGLVIDTNQPYRAKVPMDGHALMLAEASSVGVVLPATGEHATFTVSDAARDHLGM